MRKIYSNLYLGLSYIFVVSPPRSSWVVPLSRAVSPTIPLLFMVPSNSPCRYQDISMRIDVRDPTTCTDEESDCIKSGALEYNPLEHWIPTTSIFETGTSEGRVKTSRTFGDQASFVFTGESISTQLKSCIKIAIRILNNGAGGSVLSSRRSYWELDLCDRWTVNLHRDGCFRIYS